MKSLPFLGEFPFDFYIYGSRRVLSFYAELLGFPLSFPKNVELLDVFDVEDFFPGKPTLDGAVSQISFVEKAVADAKKGKIKGIVTLPINKATAVRGGFRFPGHTEFLAHLFNVKNFAMMLANERLKVVLLTTHVSLKDVPLLITEEKILRHLELIDRSLNSPKIAIAGLNPHCGEGGLFGREEVEVIIPAIEEARKKGVNVVGPVPSDTVFVRALKGEFDVVLCMYHDQGLIPIKVLGFGSSVNVTLGLPIVRTSVDHGTAYDIAGKGLADAGSFKLAVKTAVDLISGRGDPT